jgi:hypothetical protein
MVVQISVSTQPWSVEFKAEGCSKEMPGEGQRDREGGCARKRAVMNRASSGSCRVE